MIIYQAYSSTDISHSYKFNMQSNILRKYICIRFYHYECHISITWNKYLLWNQTKSCSKWNWFQFSWFSYRSIQIGFAILNSWNQTCTKANCTKISWKLYQNQLCGPLSFKSIFVSLSLEKLEAWIKCCSIVKTIPT